MSSFGATRKVAVSQGIRAKSLLGACPAGRTRSGRSRGRSTLAAAACVELLENLANILESEVVEQHCPLDVALFVPQRMLADEVMRAGRTDSEVRPPSTHDEGAIGVTVQDRAPVLAHEKEALQGPAVPLISRGVVKIDRDTLASWASRRFTQATRHRR